MADTKKKRTTVPSATSKKRAAMRQPRSTAPLSQYTDVGQRRPVSKPKRDRPAPAPAEAGKRKTAATPISQRSSTPEPSSELVLDVAAPRDDNRSTGTPGRRLRRPTLFLFFVVLIAAAGLTLWRQHRQPQSVASLVSQVSRVTVLPAHETPVVSTVVDKQQVTQAFLSAAQNGDKLLLYYQAKKAIVYRPSTHQVITIGPITEGVARVFIRAGGATAAAVQCVQAAVASDAADFTVASRDDSPNPPYPVTEIVDLTGVRPDVASKLAALLHAKVVSLPTGEQRPDGDMLVIVGQDAP